MNKERKWRGSERKESYDGWIEVGPYWVIVGFIEEIGCGVRLVSHVM